MQQAYIAIAIGSLAIIVALMLFTKKAKSETKLSPLAGLAFAFVIAGIFFSESRLIGYSLMGIGVVIALFDIAKKSKK